MVRLASVNTPQLPLQLLFRQHPQWKQTPTAVVSEDKPLGRVVSVNKKAQELGIEPGMRFAAALSLCSVLQAAVVPVDVVQHGVEEIVTILRTFTPDVEPCAFEPGLFWVNASGLETLYGSVDVWANALVATLQNADFFAAVTVGFSRFGTYACAKRRPRVQVFETPAEEATCAKSSPLSILPFPPLVHQRLMHLGVSTAGDFQRLSRGSIVRRFGTNIATIHDFVTGADAVPLQPLAEQEPHRVTRTLHTPEADRDRLTLRVADLLEPLIDALPRSEQVFSIEMTFAVEDADAVETAIRPAQPTRSIALLMKLIALRIQNTHLRGAIERITVEVHSVDHDREQEELFAELTPQSQRSADSAFALIRAELGNESILRAVLQEEHLPEQQFSLEPLYTMPKKASPGASNRTLVRRILLSPRTTDRPFHREAVALVRHRTNYQKTAAREISPERLHGGPFVITGAWWQAQFDREYYFVPTRSRRVLWVYFDRTTDSWNIQGWID